MLLTCAPLGHTKPVVKGNAFLYSAEQSIREQTHGQRLENEAVVAPRQGGRVQRRAQTCPLQVWYTMTLPASPPSGVVTVRDGVKKAAPDTCAQDRTQGSNPHTRLAVRSNRSTEAASCHGCTQQHWEGDAQRVRQPSPHLSGAFLAGQQEMLAPSHLPVKATPRWHRSTREAGR
jgi:hypothetical protein